MKQMTWKYSELNSEQAWRNIIFKVLMVVSITIAGRRALS
jgi:hypothetical protein